MIGTSLNGAILALSDLVYSARVLLSFSKRSHLFTTRTQPFLFFLIRLKIFMSCASIPVVASIIMMQTSLCSMALMERITE